MRATKLFIFILLFPLLSVISSEATFAQTATTTQTAATTQAAQAPSSGSFFCRPSNPDVGEETNRDLYTCVTRIYNYAVVVGSLVAVIMIIYAGYTYFFAGGSSASTSKAKSYIETSLVGLTILLGGFLILRQINPSLLNFPDLSPERIANGEIRDILLNGGYVTPGSGSGGAGGGGSSGVGGSSGGKLCQPSSGNHPCSVERMKACPAWQNQTELASKICNLESAGGRNLAVASGSDVCKDGNSWSFGLFQINVIAHGGRSYMPSVCKAGMFQTNGNAAQGTCLQRNKNNICVKYDCTLKADQQSNYTACRQALANADTQMRIACGLYTARRNWGDWRTSYNTCTK